MRIRLGLIVVLTVVLGLIVAQSIIAQAPAPGGGQGGPPAAGGGQRGGAPGGGAGGGQRGAPAAPDTSPIPRLDGKPDMTGYWMATTTTDINSTRGGVILDEAGNKGGKIPYNAEWDARMADTKKNHMFDEPYAHCLPAGVPTNFGIQMGFQTVQHKDAIVYAWDTVGATRIIYLDDRKHLPAGIKLYQADSIGKWDGDTLVVDTTNQEAGWWDASGAVHSDATHVVERFTMKAGNTILYEATVEDPKALTRPWKMSDTFTRNTRAYPNSWSKRPSGYEQTETACVEGDMDMALYPVSAGGYKPDSTPSNAGASAPAAGAAAPRGAAPAAGPRGAAPGGAPGGPRGQ